MKEQKHETLDKLSLIDNFLMNELVGSDEYGATFIEYFLQVVLGHSIEVKDVSVQRVATAGDPNIRSIRMDIRTKISLDRVLLLADMADSPGILPKSSRAMSNIEMQAKKGESGPGQRYDIRRRMRLHQALIDANMMKPQSKFGELDDVLIITCASFDVFGLGRARYTFTNMCLEESGLVLADGAYRIYLNTSGESGGSEELMALLKYTENSIDANVTNEKLKEIHTMVMEVKQSKEVREKYMFEWEKIERAKDEVREELQEEMREIIADKNAALADRDAALAIIKELQEKLAKTEQPS